MKQCNAPLFPQRAKGYAAARTRPSCHRAGENPLEQRRSQGQRRQGQPPRPRSEKIKRLEDELSLNGGER